MSLDIQGVLGFLDEGNFQVHQALSADPELLKEFEKNVSWMIPQWMTGSNVAAHQRDMVLRFQENCNTGWGSLYGKSMLQSKLLASIGKGNAIRHKFYHPTAKRLGSLNHIAEMLRQDYPDIREPEVIMWCRDATDDDVESLLDDHGVAMNDRDQVRKQVKKWKS